MTKSHLKIVKIGRDTAYQDWLKFRDQGIGASEVGSILGLSKWKSAHEVYYQKIGVFQQMQEENIAMFMGKTMEPVMKNIYEYWDGSEEGMMANVAAGKKVRTMYTPEFFVLNPEYPWLFFSPDGLDLHDMEHGKKYLVKGDRLYNEYIKRIGEYKTISGWAAKQYEDEFNPAYGVQLMTYLMGLEVGEGSIFTMKDGRNFSEVVLTYDEELVDQIARITKEFWERVLLGREAVEKGGNYEQFAPPADGSEAYKNFLKKQFDDPQDQIIYIQNGALIEAAQNHQLLKLQSGDLDNNIRLQENILKEYMGNAYNQIDFGPALGKVTWRADKNGVRKFVNMVKIQQEA